MPIGNKEVPASVMSQKSLYIRHPREGGGPVLKLSVRKKWKQLEKVYSLDSRLRGNDGLA